MCCLRKHLNFLTLCILISLWRSYLAETDKCGPVPPRKYEENLCYINNVALTCPYSSSHGTIVVRKCLPGLISYDGNVTYKCESDGWHQDYFCKPDCGLQTTGNKYPWMVAIYNSDEKLICGGTLLTISHVLTAASCFKYNHTLEMLDQSSYTMVAGEHDINLHENKSSSQKREIYEYRVHPKYEPTLSVSTNDIILLESDDSFVLDENVLPACIDWNSYYENWDFKDGNEGISLGWNIVKVDAVPCKRNAQFWERYTCSENLPRTIWDSYFVEGKFCAELIGNSTCGPYFGSGILFESTQGRYFLRGIASNRVFNNYISYTKISNYLSWLREQISYQEFGELSIPYTDQGCILPHHIIHGRFSLTMGTYTEDKWVPSRSTILLFCNGKVGNDRVSLFRCLNKIWNPFIETATCRNPELCPPIKASELEEVRCKLNGHEVSCEDAGSDTTLVIRCQRFFTFPGHKPIYKCQDGDWDHPFTSCVPACGLQRHYMEPNIVGGTETKPNEFPWLVGIYNSKETLICGGTIISRKFVLTAAHCFKSSRGGRPNKNNYTIIAGKYYRDMNIPEASSQTRRIKSLSIPEDYKGLLCNYRDDIALIELETEFILSLSVGPVCVDWDDAYEDFDLVDGNEGVVAGWGSITETGPLSDILKKLVVTFRPRDICLKYLPRNFSEKFVTTDKFCAGSINNESNVCIGDSGGGLYFKSDRTRYFIRGIISLSVPSHVGCDVNHYALYTKVSKYLPWIESITRKLL